jgi:erythromycin esterase-like protein
MAALVPDEAVMTVGVAAPIDQLAQAIRDRYADRVQRIGFYTIGPTTLNTDRDALREVIARLQQ